MIGQNLRSTLPSELSEAIGAQLEAATDSSMDEVAIELTVQAAGFIDRVQETLSRFEAAEGAERKEARAELMERLRDIQQFKANTQKILAAMPALKKRCGAVLAKSSRRRPAAA